MRHRTKSNIRLHQITIHFWKQLYRMIFDTLIYSKTTSFSYYRCYYLCCSCILLLLVISNQQIQYADSFSILNSNLHTTTNNRRHSIQQQHKPIYIHQSTNSINYRILQHTLYSTSTSNSNEKKNLITTVQANNNNNNMIFINGCKDIIDKYDIFLLDMWGVLHDGTVPYDGVLECCTNLYNANKTLIIVSNSSKRKNHSIQLLIKLGFNPLWFTFIITSGEIAYHILSKVVSSVSSVSSSIVQQQQQQQVIDTDIGTDEIDDNDNSSMLDGDWYIEWDKLRNTNTNKQNKNTVFIFGSGDNDIEYCTSCGWTVSTIDDATLLLARGTFTITDGQSINIIKNNDNDNNNYYDTMLLHYLQQAAIKQIPLLICNPDKIRPDADRSPMPGQIGVLYEKALQNAGITNPKEYIKSIGKPFDDVYNIALQNVQSLLSETSTTTTTTALLDKSRVCMVGDALETDVAGGTKFGIDTIWVLKDGVYKPDLQNIPVDNDNELLTAAATSILHNFNNLNDTYATGMKLAPTYVLPHFRW